MVQWLVLRFMSIGVLVPTVVIHKEGYSPLKKNNRFKSVFSIILCLLFLAKRLLIGYMYTRLMLLVYLGTHVLRFIYPYGIGDKLRYLTKHAYQRVNGVACLCFQNAKVVDFSLLKAAQFDQVFIHVLGSSDNISTFVSRMLVKSSQWKGCEKALHVCIEQPGISETRISERFPFLKVCFNMYLILAPLVINALGLLLYLMFLLPLLPLFYDAFSVKNYAKNINKVVSLCRKKGAKIKNMCVTGYSLGGLSALCWRAIYDVSSTIKLVVDRSPDPEYLAKIGAASFNPFLLFAFMIPVCMSAYLLVYTLGVYSLAYAASAAFAILLLFNYTFRLKILEWSLTKLDILPSILRGYVSRLSTKSKNLSAAVALSDQIVQREYVFSPKGCTSLYPGDHLNLPIYDLNKGKIEGFEQPCEDFCNVLNTYTDIMNKLRG
ncbi:hypothetical protein MMH89_02125 [Candidatus Comchoanobacter bicostacola]|uniref:Transmembrane protein n=1 Tax=Candidatus Comchoanobacter bicostacola TaxID=2919598 RepID=A0ABY5DKD3_9GAMM|nr:hypothetical protein [Candidatus Comchoanobacter bicostacola]UTC24945.1 hypothetical protein MMH89_02125 [Candidatus Comchoanobacter bicostacola]